AAHVEKLVDFRDDISIAVDHCYLKLRLCLVLGICLGAYLLDPLLGNIESRLHQTPARLLETDSGGFVPNNVIAAQVAGQDQHEEWITHAVKRSPKMSADVVAVPEPQRHVHLDGAQIIGNP